MAITGEASEMMPKQILRMLPLLSQTIYISDRFHPVYQREPIPSTAIRATLFEFLSWQSTNLSLHGGVSF
jgi:hypothetical protein